MRLRVVIRRDFARYTADTKNAIYYALLESHQRGDGTLTLDDLLFGLTYKRHSGTCGFRSLNELGDSWRVATGRGPRIVRTDEHAKKVQAYKFGFGTVAMKALRAAAKEADRDGEFWIDTDHLQRGILLQGGKPENLLKEAGFTFEETKRLGMDGRKDHPPRQPTIRERLNVYPVLFPLVGFGVGFVLVLLYLHVQQ